MNYSRTLLQILAATALLWVASWAQAEITCTAPTSTGITTAYTPTQTVSNSNQGTFSTTCTRSSETDELTVLLNVDDGHNSSGVQNRAKSTGKFIFYETYMDSSCSASWNNFAAANQLTLTLSNVLTPQTIAVPSYWVCITVAGQLVKAGIYTDTVTMRVRNSTDTANLSHNGTFSVSITNPATCDITSVDNVEFGTYLAFRNTALDAPAATIVMNCTLDLPYSLSLDATSGAMVGVGLNYTLTLSASGQQSGAGPGQTFTISGTMPAGQAGTCSTGTCSGSATRTLLVTY